MSLIAESLERASEEWRPNRYETVGHILSHPLPLKYSNFRSHRVLRNIVFSSGLLLGTILVGFLVVGGPADDGPVQAQVPPASPEKVSVAATPPTVKEVAVPASKFTLPDRTTPAEEKQGVANEELASLAPRSPVVENTSKRDKVVAIKNEVATQPRKTIRKETAKPKIKPVIKSPETVREKIVAVADEPALQPQKTDRLVQLEPARVFQPAAPSLPEDSGVVNSREAPSQEKVRVVVQARASVPARKEPIGEEDLFHDSEYYFNLALYYQQKKNYLKALELYDQALQLDPVNARSYNNRSLIYQKLGNKDKAVEGFLKAIRLDPGYGKAYNNMGLVYYAEGNYSVAVANFEKAITLDENNLESYNNLAIVYKKLNRLNEAKALYKKILALVPSHAEASYNLATLFEEEGNIESAVKFYRRFVKMGAGSHPSLASKVRNHLKVLE